MTDVAAQLVSLGGIFANGAQTAAFSYLFVSTTSGQRQSTRSRMLDRLTPEQRAFIERLEGQDVFRSSDAPFIFERFSDVEAISSFPDFEPGGYPGLVDDLRLHSGFQQRYPSLSRPGEFHLSVETFPRFGRGVYLHYDAIGPMGGVGSTVGHGVLEVIPNLNTVPDVRNRFPDFP